MITQRMIVRIESGSPAGGSVVNSSRKTADSSSGDTVERPGGGESTQTIAPEIVDRLGLDLAFEPEAEHYIELTTLLNPQDERTQVGQRVGGDDDRHPDPELLGGLHNLDQSLTIDVVVTTRGDEHAIGRQRCDHGTGLFGRHDLGDAEHRRKQPRTRQDQVSKRFHRLDSSTTSPPVWVRGSGYDPPTSDRNHSRLLS